MTRVTVKVQLGHFPSEQDITACLDISPQLINKAAQSLDIPKDGTDPIIAATFCTPTQTILEVKQFRRMAAKVIANDLASYIEQAFGLNDTENGYKKDAKNG